MVMTRHRSRSRTPMPARCFPAARTVGVCSQLAPASGLRPLDRRQELGESRGSFPEPIPKYNCYVTLRRLPRTVLHIRRTTGIHPGCERPVEA